MVGAFARADNAPTEQCLPGPSVAMALWWGLAEALGAPVLPHEVDEAHREATRAAVRARRQVQPSG